MNDSEFPSMLQAFELFERVEVIKDGEANLQLINSLHKPEILELADFLVKGFESRPISKCPVGFSHSTSLSLSSRSKCEHFEHRLRDLLSCAQFSVLYSDRVYVHNFFSDYAEDLRHRNVIGLRASIIDDINLILAIKPLLVTGHIELFIPEIHSCTNCLEQALPAETLIRIQTGQKSLSKEFFENISVRLKDYSRSKFSLEINGPSHYLEHPLILKGKKSTKLNALLESNRGFFESLRSGGSVELPKSFLKQSLFHEKFAADIAESVTTSILTSQMRHSSFLTDNDLDISFLNLVIENEEIERRNAIAFRCLTSSLPFIEDVSLVQLIELRNQEDDAFIVYRSALNKAISEFKAIKNDLSEKQANQLYSDVIEPKLAQLNQKVKSAKKEIFSSGLRSVVATTGVLTFGLYTGILSPELATALGTLGVGKVGVDLLKDVLPIGKSDLVAETDDLYFLWKVKRMARSD